MSDITVVIPTIPPRREQLTRALTSVYGQRLTPDHIVVQIDSEKQGAALNRDAGLEQVTTTWTAFLDDDDVFYPQHLAYLLEEAEKTDADLVYPWFDVLGGTDPFPQFEGLPWDSEAPHQVPITFLVKTDLAKAVGGFSGDWNDENALDENGHRMGEDLHFIYKFVAAGHKIVHLNERTWGWYHWSLPNGSVGNTSGLPSRW